MKLVICQDPKATLKHNKIPFDFIQNEGKTPKKKFFPRKIKRFNMRPMTAKT